VLNATLIVRVQVIQMSAGNN